MKRPLPLQGAEVPRISRKSAHVGGKDVNPTNRPSLPQKLSLVLISVTIVDII